ncbi:unnamed protein product [Cyclocybe aegerita]|uniref:Matrin-type domain-containing protein n=1 Tax=Cyclocybe aegerita TaxID=1973307 RepID=A0A8S0WGS2_CYCAE|nr:unnamed protein product [Cyclocybe aegerita]
MSEYWVSKKKYFCKYCDIFIADDAPSRQQHENGLRHKGNVERFIRGIYKTGEKQKKDLEEEMREMRRVEQAAAVAFSQDVGAGLAKARSGPVASTSASTSAKKPLKSSNPFADYSTAASLGYTDPDAERIAAELEIRRSQGVAGEWQILTPPPPAGAPWSETPESSSEATSDIGVKREAEAPPEDDARSFKLRKRTINTGLGEIYDPGVIKVKEVPKEERVESKPPPAPSSSTVPIGDAQHQFTAIQLKKAKGTSTSEEKKEETDSGGSKWTKPQWSEPLPSLKQEDRMTIFGNAEPEVKVETQEKVKAEEVILSPVLPVEQPATSVMFKKRKAPVGARGRREV